MILLGQLKKTVINMQTTQDYLNVLYFKIQ